MEKGLPNATKILILILGSQPNCSVIALLTARASKRILPMWFLLSHLVFRNLHLCLASETLMGSILFKLFEPPHDKTKTKWHVPQAKVI